MFLQVKVGIPTKDFLARFPSTTVQFVAIGIKGVNLSKANTWYWKIHHVNTTLLALLKSGIQLWQFLLASCV